jgi:6-phosphogluconolactonase
MRRIEIVPDPAAETAERVAAAASAGGHIALTGGATPQAAYERLAEMDVEWSGCELWFGDERCVPPADPRSNFGMAQKSLLDRLGERAPPFHRMEGELGPYAGADAYERELRETVGEGMPVLDLILLGLGPDAHCASLFPGSPALEERSRAVVGVEEAGLEPFVPRITLTFPAINAARAVLFLVTGAEKADAVARAVGDPHPSAPASLVAPDSGNLTWLLDPAAAARLPEKPVG